MPKALLLDDDVDSLEALDLLVAGEGFETKTATTLAEAIETLGTYAPDVIITDLMLPDGQGLDLLDKIEPPYDPEVVLITAHATVETAVAALRSGVSDYLTKPIDVARVRSVLAHVARASELKGEVENLRDQLRSLGHYGRLVGTSKAMSEIYDLIGRVAPTDAGVLVTGESGTGKELVAQTLHDLSRRRKGPFVAVNCGAVSPNLIESQLFGHERGSFTGAEKMHRGHFEQASAGTLFLDEFTEMPVELQVKLLRVLESRTVTRVGSEEPLEIDVRIIAATNRDPDEAVEQGQLREDLHYRLSVFPIHLPPLRDRGEDIVTLAEYFLEKLNRDAGKSAKLSKAARDALRGYEWPGNVRQLANAIQRAHILADAEILVEHLPERVTAATGAVGDPGAARSAKGPVAETLRIPVGMSAEAAEKRLILATLEHFDGNKQETADALGVSLKTLYNRLNAYKAESS